MKIAIVGAGLYGSVISLKLADTHKITLYEKKNDIMQCASGINQFRLHSGYHYPRSLETLKEIQSSLLSFNEYFNKNIYVNSQNYYAIARQYTKSTPHDFEKFCDNNKLFLNEKKLNFLNYSQILKSYEVEERVIDPTEIKKQIYDKLLKSKVNLKLNNNIKYDKLKKDYDLVILCTYGHDYSILDNQVNFIYKFQIVEKILISIPNIKTNTSLVVIDGPFFCLDPFGHSNNFIMGHVTHAVHSQNIGYEPNIPIEYKQYLHNGLHTNFPFSKHKIILKESSKYMPDLCNAKYEGSFLVTRCVKPNVEKTDERTSSINIMSDNLITIHSGKLVSCVSIANKILNLI